MSQRYVQCGVVLHQRVVLIVPDELHHRCECQRVREAVLPIAVVNLDQFVVPVFPESDEHAFRLNVSNEMYLIDISFEIFLLFYLSVRVKSPCDFVDASRTIKEPSGLSLRCSFTSSLWEEQWTSY